MPFLDLAPGGPALHHTDRPADPAAPRWYGPLVHRWTFDQIRHLRVPDPGLADELVHYDPRPYLPSITTPLHYVRGRWDAIPLAVVEQAAALGTRTTLTVVDDAGHLPHVEVPGRFAEILTDLVRTSAAE